MPMSNTQVCLFTPNVNSYIFLMKRLHFGPMVASGILMIANISDC